MGYAMHCWQKGWFACTAVSMCVDSVHLHLPPEALFNYRETSSTTARIDWNVRDDCWSLIVWYSTFLLCTTPVWNSFAANTVLSNTSDDK